MSLAKLVALKTMTIGSLRSLWLELYKTPSKSNSREFLIKRLTYRIQELKSGGDSAETIARLARLSEEYGGKTRRENIVPIGTVLIREYHGVEHQVASVIGGFEYNGCKFRSLSAIAKHITGMHWSGMSFFGLPKSPRRLKR